MICDADRHGRERVYCDRQGLFRLFACIGRRGLLEAAEDGPAERDGFVARRLDAIESLGLVLELADDLSRAGDEVGLRHLDGPMECGATVHEAVLRVPGVLEEAERLGRELVDDLGLPL